MQQQAAPAAQQQATPARHFSTEGKRYMVALGNVAEGAELVARFEDARTATDVDDDLELARAVVLDQIIKRNLEMADVRERHEAEGGTCWKTSREIVSKAMLTNLYGMHEAYLVLTRPEGELGRLNVETYMRRRMRAAAKLTGLAKLSAKEIFDLLKGATRQRSVAQPRAQYAAGPSAPSQGLQRRQQLHAAALAVKPANVQKRELEEKARKMRAALAVMEAQIARIG